jgi:trehalose/maltose hydrolase-like predicted phosphorylase
LNDRRNPSVSTSPSNIVPEPVDDPLWKVEVAGYDRFRERELESWFTVANGRTGTRGSLEEGTPESNPAVYVAGIYGRPPDGGSGPVLLLGPVWPFLAPRVGDSQLRLEVGEVLEHRRILDLRHGILYRIWRQRLSSGAELTFRTARFASQADRAVLVLQAVGHSSDGMAVALVGDIPLPSNASFEDVITSREGDHLHIELNARKGGRAAFSIGTDVFEDRLERIVAVSRAAPGAEFETSANDALATARAQGMGELHEHHRSAWQERWRAADVVVEGDPTAQLALRFALYHLMSAGDPDSDLASIGARGLTGPGYDGHVFWDTDVFMLPFFLHSQTEVARRLLGYRLRTLPAARARASSLGYRGALYPWESADVGDDCTPPLVVSLDGSIVPVLTGLEEHHISADVAWAAWRYWESTHDQDFLHDVGAEIIVETARFWASRARRGRDGCHHIAPVIGPDEYHEGVRDNAYTNRLAKWNLERGLEVAEHLSSRDPAGWRALAQRLRLRQSEFARWRNVAQTLVDPFNPSSLLLEQFEGYFGLEDIIAAELAPRPFAADVVLGPERLRRSQVIKQADVVMLMHLLPEAFSREMALANFRYYEPRTSHGSSLSPAVHAAVAARLGLTGEALAYFRMAASVDLDDRMGNAAQGIHMAAAGGLWQAAVFGFGGVRPEADCLRIDARLPDAWSRLAFPFAWRGQVIRVDAGPSEMEIELESPAAIALGQGKGRRLGAGRYRSGLERGEWSQPKEVETSRLG